MNNFILPVFGNTEDSSPKKYILSSYSGDRVVSPFNGVVKNIYDYDLLYGMINSSNIIRFFRSILSILSSNLSFFIQDFCFIL